MLFMAEMTVRIPSTLAPEVADEIKRKEKEYSQQLQRDGKWRHLWRVVGEYANVSIFDVSGNDELHAILSGLPLFPYMEIKVTPLANHPSSIVQE
ncbi:muconolactone delta-isomerase [Paracidovorax avenae]|uniref:Muconolactone Delta-isomerase n=1 Tax=Paracidovorax avenae (strain ATCC 19860 / DSM 7227 / CCUG 15838 / JCM 20985 / LMG 2117 / NCPPB 1011) TaxID=643561 RepID=F0Q1T4_PARA1|nr:MULTISPECIES: muconolactone Delta-isomerase [Pseudomonadota]ADX47726.1 muconolactone delta-isomerase [Paracidovorax avenae ATCC 19860]AVS66108.1 muconolactone delta-isomerase [Paracidovorax avenae]AVS71722.1 muconolactone delta-isomerase [Paracidovorax avenae]AVS78806.1 muconolactone delta-isomerase [Paracidovorax avenae]AVS93673.1 muconolactone delta-isomerase [Paracidovorax avenae]